MRKLLLLVVIIFLIIIAGILGYLIVVRTATPKIRSSSIPTQVVPQISPSGPTALSPNICSSHGYPLKDDFLTKYKLSASAGNYFVVQGIITEIDSDHWVVQGNLPKESKGTDTWVQPSTKYIGKQNYKVGDCVTVVVNTVGDASQKGNQQAVVVASQ